MCIKKVPERVSFLRSLVICYITELCLGAVLAGVYSVVKQPIELFSMGIGYLVLALMVWGWIIYRKEIQKYAIYAVDVYSFLILTLFFGVVFLKVFTPEIVLVYKNSDPGTHYTVAKKILETKTVGRMYFAGLHNTMIMELCKPFMAEISLYKAYILADSLSNYINLLMFYCLIAGSLRSKFTKIAAPLIGILYFLGWPFYSYVAGGYGHFGVGITLFMYVIYLLLLLRKSKEKSVTFGCTGLMILGIFSVTTCYLLFTPILCLAAFLCEVVILKERNVVIPKKVLLIGAGAITIVGLILFCIVFWGFFGGDINRIFYSLRIEGGIHRELYKDFIFLIPPVIYMSRHYYKKKEADFLHLTWVAVAGVTVIAFAASLCGLMSGYYFYKLYYLNWVFLWVVCVQAIEYFWKEKKIIVYSYGIPAVVAVFMMFFGMDDYLISRDLTNENSPSLFPLYSVTKEYIQESKETEEMGALRSVSRYINENYADMENDIVLINSLDKFNYCVWYRAFTGYEYTWADRSNEGDKSLEKVLEGLENDEYQYFLILKTADCYMQNEDLMQNYNAVYDDGYFGLYQIN